MSGLLIVDDQDDMLEEVCELFERKGQTVVRAQDTLEAANQFFKSVSNIAAVLIDLRLKDPTIGDRAGFELACRLRGYNRFIPIFIYSASDIDPEVKRDPRVNGTFRKGGSVSEKINVEEILSAGKAYWDDFHRDDPNELLDLKKRLGMTQSDFLRLVEPKTPLRHERIVDLVLDKEGLELPSGIEPDDPEWTLENITQEEFTIQSQEGEELSLTARVSHYSKAAEGSKAMLTSMPMLFAYADDEASAIENLAEILQTVYEAIEYSPKTPKDEPMSFYGSDFLRLKGFFKRVSSN